MQLSNALTCAELVELVTDYLEGALGAVDCERFEKHLSACPWCRSYLDQMRRTVATVGRLREEDLAPEVEEAFLAAFRDWKAS